MTVTSIPVRNDYNGDGVATVFPFTFRILDRTALEVLLTTVATGAVTTLVLDTNYTVSGVNNAAGGSITITTGAPASGVRVTIRRATPVTQPTRIANQGGAFLPAVHENVFDRLTMIAQEHADVIDRSVTMPNGVSGIQLPTPVAGKILGWDPFTAKIINTDLLPGPPGSQGVAGLNGTLPIYATRAARNAAVTSPTDGYITRVLDTGAIEEYRSASSSWWVVYDKTYVINVKSRGAKGDGVTDDGPLIASLVAEATANPLSPIALYFPQSTGQYIIRNELAMRGVRGMLVYGDGSFASQIRYEGAAYAYNTCVWRVENCQYCVWSNIFIQVASLTEFGFLSYNNASWSGSATPTNNRWTNVVVETTYDGSGPVLRNSHGMIYMPFSPSYFGNVTVAAGGKATLDNSGYKKISTLGTGPKLRFLGDGTLTIAAAGATTFSVTQAGKIQDGSKLYIDETMYTVSGFNGTTGATLAGAPVTAARTFKHAFSMTQTPNGRIDAVANAVTFSHSMTGYLANGAVININGAGLYSISGLAGDGLSATVGATGGGGSLPLTIADRSFTVVSGGTNNYKALLLYPDGFSSAAFGAWSNRTFESANPTDNNNDLNTYTGCQCNGYKYSGWLVGHSQAKIHRFYACEFQGAGYGDGITPQYGVKVINGSIRWHDGNGGGNRDGARTKGADFYFGQPMDNNMIWGGDFEGSTRLLETATGFGPPYNISILGTRWAGDMINIDGYAVDYSWGGPLTIEKCHFGSGSSPNGLTKFRIRAGGNFRFVGNDIEGFNSATTQMFKFDDVLHNAWDIEISQNSFVDSGGGQVTGTVFAPGETAPFVHFGHNYRTGNTTLTIIRDLQDAYPNQQITIHFNDNMTILQSGGRIQLQNSFTWGTPSSPIPRGSSITLVYNHALGVFVETARTLFAPSNNIATDLVAAVEAASVPGAVYAVFDARYNVDVSGTRVVAWTDARGRMYGPRLVPTGAQGPTWDDTNKYLVFGGSLVEALRAGVNSQPIIITGAGTVTVSGGAGAAVFSVTQAGRLVAGDSVIIGGASYSLSTFDGTTGGTLSGAPNMAASAFTHQFRAGNAGVVVVTDLSGSPGGELAGWGSLSASRVAVELAVGGANISAQTRLGAITSGTIAHGAGTRSLYFGRRTQSGGNIVLAVAKDGGVETASASTADASFVPEVITVGGRGGDTVPNPITAKIRAVIFLTVEPTAGVRSAIRTWSSNAANHGTP